VEKLDCLVDCANAVAGLPVLLAEVAAAGNEAPRGDGAPKEAPDEGAGVPVLLAAGDGAAAAPNGEAGPPAGANEKVLLAAGAAPNNPPPLAAAGAGAAPNNPPPLAAAGAGAAPNNPPPLAAAGAGANENAGVEPLAANGLAAAAGAAAAGAFAAGEAAGALPSTCCSCFTTFSKRGLSSASALPTFICAACSAVRPLLVATLGSAPAFSSRGTQSSQPSEAA